MEMKKPLRITLTITGSLMTLVVLVLIIGVAPLDRTLDYKPLLDTMNARIDEVDVQVVPATGGFKIGYSKVNLTPREPIATAGYGKRLGRLYKSVHDSIYVRTLVIDNGTQRVAIVSAGHD